MMSEKPLRDKVGMILDRIDDLDNFYHHNEEVLDIYEGDLLPYVQKLMSETLDPRYYKLIEHRILPINFIQKIVDKLSKSYSDSPMRTCEDQEFIDEMETMLDIDQKMMTAEELSHLNRGYALKPKLTNKGKIKLEVIPYDKFLVIAEDHSDMLEPTIFVEFLGRVERQIVEDDRRREAVERDCYIAYTDTEIWAFDETGAHLPEIAEELNYRNPVGMIPFVYGNRSMSSVVPKQDTDFLRLSKVLPLMLSDINGAIMFQCFTLIYGIDVNFKDATMSPNAIWELESDKRTDKTPQIGTLEPTVDSEKALSWFKNVLAMWLDTKGIDAGSIMSLDSQSIASGLSKAMDELDTTEARKKSIGYLKNEEKKLFKLLARLNNYWFTLPQSRDLGLRRVDVDVIDETIEVDFKEPMPKLDYTTEIDNSVKMLDNGLSYREKEIKRLHPYITDDEIEQIFAEAGLPREVEPVDDEDMNNNDMNEDVETNNNEEVEE